MTYYYFQTRHWCARENYQPPSGTATTTALVHFIRISNSHPDTIQLHPFLGFLVFRIPGFHDYLHNLIHFTTDLCTMTFRIPQWVQVDIIQTLVHYYCNLQDRDISPEVIMAKHRTQNSDTRITDWVQNILHKTPFQVSNLIMKMFIRILYISV